MNAHVIGANVLPLVENHFGFLVQEHGFTLARTSDIPTGAWYNAPGGAVAVKYDLMRDAALDVTLEEKVTGESHLLTDVLALTVPGADRRVDVRAPEAFLAEAKRMRALLAEHCGEFLRGDMPAFRARHREALLVKHCRRVAMEEFQRGDLRRAARLLSAMRAYWTEGDREIFERASPVGSPISYLSTRR
jgi:hypothetical protein